MSSLQEDMDAFKGGTKEYFERIWEETELDGDDLSEIDDFDDCKSLVESLLGCVNNAVFLRRAESEAPSDFRRRLYNAFLEKFEKDGQKAFAAWLNALNIYIEEASEKREYIARYMKRVLRGELCRGDHRPVDKANKKLKDDQRPVWVQNKAELGDLCKQLRLE